MPRRPVSWRESTNPRGGGMVRTTQVGPESNTRELSAAQAAPAARTREEQREEDAALDRHSRHSARQVRRACPDAERRRRACAAGSTPPATGARSRAQSKLNLAISISTSTSISSSISSSSSISISSSISMTCSSSPDSESGRRRREHRRDMIRDHRRVFAGIVRRRATQRCVCSPTRRTCSSQ